MLFRSVYNYKNYQVNLIYNLNELRFFINVLLKDQYVNNNISKEEAIEYLTSQGFYSKKEAEKIWQKIIFPNNYYLDKYLASLKLNKIEEAKAIMNLYAADCLGKYRISTDPVKFIEKATPDELDNVKFRTLGYQINGNKNKFSHIAIKPLHKQEKEIGRASCRSTF